MKNDKDESILLDASEWESIEESNPIDNLKDHLKNSKTGNTGLPVKLLVGKEKGDIVYSNEVEFQPIKFFNALKENDIEITKTILGNPLTDEKGTYK